jgi:hypothetical protein
MRAYWAASLGLVALLATEGCKQKEPEPIPGPKAPGAMVLRPDGAEIVHPQAAGIAWFQGSLDEAFARPGSHATCAAVRAPMTPLTPDLPRAHTHARPPAPATTPRRPLV